MLALPVNPALCIIGHQPLFSVLIPVIPDAATNPPEDNAPNVAEVAAVANAPLMLTGATAP